jgi:hypothetical protein
MFPRDLHISYLGQSFTLLPLDATPALPSEISQIDAAQGSTSIVGFVEALGMPELISGLPLIDLTTQAAQKAGTLYYADPLRPTDVKDLSLILSELKNSGTYDSARLRALIIQDLNFHGLSRPFLLRSPHTLENEYERLGLGSNEEFHTTIRIIAGLLQFPR